MRSIKKGGNMFIGVITYTEGSRIEKLEVKHSDIFKLLEIVANFNDLKILEIHIINEVI